MFTGIIEDAGQIIGLEKEGSNLHLKLASSLAPELKIDQSLAHNGVCLTVVACNQENYTVTAIEETLIRTNLGQLQVGDIVNLERAMPYNGRLDGHIVQGHVDKTGQCLSIEEVDGSWYFRFSYEIAPEHLLVDKGSICINGVSLTVVNPSQNEFSVAIIPYTYEHTSFKQLKVGDTVNLEFDILGKYVARYAAVYQNA
ncbi:riboflavin synthase [Saprospira sp. CCB-QB6]|uniref:riboflavin synthase n=1 Tax=Saprospira sp. CCB-QB6 TaxID=3023936 RepID=UPI00234B58D9|nr:riboflavin synthase [Saprospira sp. CCB-QB6]WCL81546.1 riboflavin synthase [Saprospira sp. CCB-QB6]